MKKSVLDCIILLCSLLVLPTLTACSGEMPVVSLAIEYYPDEGAGVVSVEMVEGTSVGEGLGSIADPYHYRSGTELKLTAIPAEGWEFDHWSRYDVNNDSAPMWDPGVANKGEFQDNPMNISVEHDTRIYAVCYQNAYLHAWPVPEEGGTVNATSDLPISELPDNTWKTRVGANVTLTAVPKAGYRFVRWEGWNGISGDTPGEWGYADTVRTEKTFVQNMDGNWSWRAVFELGEESSEEVGVPVLIAPDLGETVTTPNVSFSWMPVEGATKYRFELDNNIDFGSLVYTVDPASAGAIIPSSELLRGQTYFWRVKSLKPVDGGWSEVGDFIVASIPDTATAIPTFSLPEPEEVLYGYLYIYINCSYFNEDCIGCTLSADFTGEDLTGGEYPVTSVVLKVNGQELFDSGAISETQYDGTASMSAGCGQTYDFELTVTDSIGLEGVVTETVVAQAAE